jgi:type IV pilus assembly protein PilV
MNKNTGFTLIEVLIAMLVLAVGLLGLAGLQAASLGKNQSAYNRSQATQLAYDLADRMRANVAGVATYTAITPISTATAKANCLTTTGCTPAEMAENDLFEWNSAVNQVLPSGSDTIAVTSGVFTITITWVDNNNNLSFQTDFRL